MLDLYHATRDDLIAIILEQREALADRERRLAAQEQELAEVRRVVTALTAQVGAGRHQRSDAEPSSGPPPGMPGLKPTEAAVRGARPRKARTINGARRRMLATNRVVHALAHCPDCGTPLAWGSVKRTREVIGLPAPTIVVTEHVYLERGCPECGRRCVPPPDVAAVVTGKSRLGHGLVSLIATLREDARLPVRVIQRLVHLRTGLQLSTGAIVQAVQRVAARAAPLLAAIEAAIRASPVVHADETGWREAGRNGYVWTFCTPTQQLFLHGGRDKQMLGRGLGDDFAGIMVSDFYGVYTGHDGEHQYCWAHLLREIHELTIRHPDDGAVQGWAVAVGAVLAEAQAGATGSRASRWRVRRRVQADLRRLCEPWQEPRVAQTPLCNRLLRHLESLFVFVTEPEVPATNNAAERSLRPLVVSRKISGGTRSPQGTTTMMALASLFGTWRLQGLNPYDACRTLLASPQA